MWVGIMSMLTINEEQMDVFGCIQYITLKAEIDKLLTSNIPEWKELKEAQKNQWIDFLIGEANKVPLAANSERVYFSLACMSAQEGCQDFLKRDDVTITLLDKFISNDRKISLLTEFAKIKGKDN